MFWKNLKIANKILFANLFILLFVVIIGIWSSLSINNLKNSAEELAAGNKIKSDLLQRELDHLNWASQLNSLLTDEAITELKVQTDPTQCAFGKWYYGEERKIVEQMLPDLAKPLTEIEAHHNSLHESAQSIGNTYKPADATLPALFANLEISHLIWAETVQSAIIEKNETLDVQMDHTKCGLGLFLYEGMADELIKLDSTYNEHITNLKLPHEKLHESAKVIAKELQNDAELAYVQFQDVTKKYLSEVRYQLDEIKQHSIESLEGVQKAEAIYSTDTKSSLTAVQNYLHEMINIAQDNIISEDELINKVAFSRLIIIIISIVALFLGFLIAWLVAKGITKPIVGMVHKINEMSLGKIVDTLTIGNKDECGQMAEALNRKIATDKSKTDVAKSISLGDMTTWVELASDEDELGYAIKKMRLDLKEIIRDIRSHSDSVASSSTELSAVSNQMSNATTEMSAQASSVSDATQQMSSGVNELSNAVDEMSTGMQSVSATSTEMSTNMNEVSNLMDHLHTIIKDVSDHSQNASKVTVEAISRSETATSTIHHLTNSAREIGEVTEMIKEIAQQTNLLALNANIEAASAGEAGKGFAVVANEIKELAKQSSSSAEDISKKINDIQQSTEESEIAIKAIADVIAEINASSADITNSTSKGTESVDQVVLNIQEAVSGIKEIAKLISEMSQTASKTAGNSKEIAGNSNEVFSNMTDLTKVVHETASGVSQIHAEAGQLSKMASELQALVEHFKLQ